MAKKPALFSLGRLVATPGALVALERSGETAFAFFHRHEIGDWGEVPPEDRQANDQALVDGERLLSAYRTRLGTRLWVLTEADRSRTTILLPEEY
jgi:hypothetical protein